MPKNSGQASRNIGLNHGNGKGDKTRVTDVKAYRENFDEINWRRPVNIFEHCLPKSKPTLKEIIRLGKKMSEELLRPDAQRLRTLREIEDEEFAWRHGL